MIHSGFFDGKIVHVRAVTQEILDWLDESDMEYLTQPHLTRWRYGGPKLESDVKVFGGPHHDSDYHRNGDDIIFEKEEDRMHFQLRWAEYIKSDDDPLEF